MPKSLEINSHGLEFDQFMKAIARVPVEKPERKKRTKKKAAPKNR
jgi:hypothetical protein